MTPQQAATILSLFMKNARRSGWPPEKIQQIARDCYGKEPPVIIKILQQYTKGKDIPSKLTKL